MKKRLLLILIAVSAIVFNSCKKNENPNADTPTDFKDKVAPDGFSYSTTRNVNINVRLLSRTNQPISGVLVSFYKSSNVVKGAEITQALSDKNGYITTSLAVASSIDTLVIDPAYIGLIRNAKAFIGKDGNLSGVIGGENGYSGNIVERADNEVSSNGVSAPKLSSKFASTGTASSSKTTYIYDEDDFDSFGRPKDRVAVDDIDFSELMALVNEALPESKTIKDKYIATEAPSNLSIVKLSDVWVTFFHEGADYRNSLGYYTYPTGHAPKSASDIDKVTLVFPNASLKGGNGKGTMLQGDKVKIGRFPAGTSIGFVLLQNAYEGNGDIDFNAAKFYTDEELNPEQGKLKRHNVLLYNSNQKTFLLGFEDINRSAGNQSDNDFNDLVIYAQSNPVDAISPVGVPYLDEKVEDTDGDGVPDVSDKYPSDPKRAYDRYYPSENIWGTTAFEDQWPSVGDYDLNDLVISYRYKFAMNKDNKVVDLTGEYKTLAAGADFQNGFGVQLPLSPSAITTVTGYNISANSYIKLGFNGLESGQSDAVFIPFDNHKNLFTSANGMINTKPEDVKLMSKTVKVEMLFNNPLNDDFTALAPFNPFMISNQKRGNEIHLVNKKPTALANLSLLKTMGDDSNPATGRYYVTAENKPFALDIYGAFDYPVETRSITDTYKHFSEWAKSGGTSYPNWYLDLPGYRNDTYIYK